MPELDAALRKVSTSGKFTLVWDEDGDLVFDDTAVYPVLTTLYTRKGEDYWDETGEAGTYLHTVKQDKFTTGSQLEAYTQDALDQCKVAGIIQGGTVRADRVRSGSWQVMMAWDRAGKRHEPPGGDLKV